jgi:hypothetical protein
MVGQDSSSIEHSLRVGLVSKRYGSGRKAVGNYRLSTLGEVMSKENKHKKSKNNVALL